MSLNNCTLFPAIRNPYYIPDGFFSPYSTKYLNLRRKSFKLDPVEPYFQWIMSGFVVPFSSVINRRLITVAKMHMFDDSSFYEVARQTKVFNRWHWKRFEAKQIPKLSYYFDHIELMYITKIEKASRFMVEVMKDGELISFNPPQRFSKQYNARTMYKIFPLSKIGLESFWTLTVPAVFNNSLSYFDRMRSISTLWARLRTFVSKRVSQFTYLRTFELQKNGMIHIHVGVYNYIDSIDLADILKYWQTRNGFASFSVFAGDFKYQSWISDDLQEVTWKPSRVVDPLKTGTFITSYIWKYMLKQPTVRDRSILWYFGVRTYSISRNLSWVLRKWKTSDVEFIRTYYNE